MSREALIDDGQHLERGSCQGRAARLHRHHAQYRHACREQAFHVVQGSLAEREHPALGDVPLRVRLYVPPEQEASPPSAEQLQRTPEEERWMVLADPAVMLECLGAAGSERKRRLFACACVRRIADVGLAQGSMDAIAAAERHADGEMDAAALSAVQQKAREASSEAVRRAHSVWSSGPAALDARQAWMRVWAANAAENTCDPFASVSVPETSVPLGDLAVRTAQLAGWVRNVSQESHGVDEEAPTETALFFSFLRSLRETVQRSQRAVLARDPTNETVIQADLVREIFGNPHRPCSIHDDWKTPTVLKIARAIYQDRAWDDMPYLSDALEDAGCKDAALLEHCRGSCPHVRGCWAIDLLLGLS